MLDPAAPDRPVWLQRVDGHAGWANSEAMRLAKVDKDTKAPSDGQIIRDSAGTPPASSSTARWAWSAEPCPAAGKDDIKRRLLAAQEIVLEQGLTGVHDAGISRAVAEAYRELDREGKLVVRIYGMASLPAGGEVAFVEPAAAGIARERAVRAAGDQALHRRRDGLARRPACSSPTTTIRATPGCS